MKALLLSFITIILTSCSGQTPHVGRIGPDRDIVLINIQNGDRAFIAKILSKIDSIKPKVVGINIYFKSPKEAKEDSLLYKALNILKGEIITYGVDRNGIVEHSIPMFTAAVDAEGFLKFEETNGLVSEMIPVKQINGKKHESIALKIAKLWKPELDNSYSYNKSLPIEYSRTLNSFLAINGTDLIELPITEFDLENLKNKIFLVGYVGPDDEDMYRTPLRFLNKDLKAQNQPDTYGLVIIANQIRTLLDKNTN
jgi:CHASE2 domain-containing sensor protein